MSDKKMNRKGLPILTSEIGSRISDISSRVGGKKRLADMTGMSESQLHRIISGESQAKIESIALIANACNVSIGWLATGEGQQTLSAPLAEAEKDMVDAVFLGDKDAEARRETRFKSYIEQVNQAEAQILKKAKKLDLNLDDVWVVTLKDILSKGLFDEEALIKVLQAIKHCDTRENATAIDRQTFRLVFSGVESGLALSRKTMPADKKIEMCWALYDAFKESQVTPTESNVVAFIRAGVA